MDMGEQMIEQNNQPTNEKEKWLDFPSHTLKVSKGEDNKDVFELYPKPQASMPGDLNSLIIRDEKRGLTIQLQSKENIRQLIHESWIINQNFFATDKLKIPLGVG